MKWPWEKKNEQLQLQLIEQKQTFEGKLLESQDLTVKAVKGAMESAMRNFNTQIFPKFNAALQEKAYQNSDNLYSVVSRIANAAASIPFFPEYKDGSDVTPKDKIWPFLDTLTLEQRIELISYFLIQGEMFAYKEKIDFGVNAGVQRLRVLNPSNVIVFITQTFPLEVVGFRFWDSVNGYTVDILPEDMMFVKMFNPDTDAMLRIRGLSPVSVLKKRLQRSDSGLDISIAQMQNGGVPGIVYDKTPGQQTVIVNGVEVGAQGQRKDQFGRYLRNNENKGAPYFASGEMGYLAIGSTLADLDLAELSAIDLDQICNVYHVSSTEFNNKQSSTESNVATHSKSFYINGVLPIVCLLRDGLNRQVLNDIDTKATLREDISDVTVLQEDMLRTMQAAAASPVMIPNAVLEKAGEKRVMDDPNMEKPWIKSGYTLLDEASITVQPIDNAAGDYDNTIDNAIKRLTDGGGK